MRQIAQQDRRDIEPSGYLNDLKLPGFEKLRILRWDADLLVLHPLFEDRHAMRVIGPSVQQFERFAEVLPRLARHLQFFGRFEDTAKGTATTEVSAAELLAGNAK